MKPMTQLNGDAKVIVQRVDDLKETMKAEFKENREDHQKIFDILSKHGTKIASNCTYVKVGWALFAIIGTLIIKIMIG